MGDGVTVALRERKRYKKFVFQLLGPTALRGLLATVLVILSHGQVLRITPELAPPFPNFRSTPMKGRLSLYLTCIGSLCKVGLQQSGLNS
ncbi:hypothetical protein TNCV_180531 [Trichonephila clavipes]|nr:hypothetical protein TNCV_180531 [Trichonephila clavipes]